MKILKHYLDKKRANRVNSIDYDEAKENLKGHVTIVLYISFGLNCFQKCILILNISYMLGLSWFIILELWEDLYIKKDFKEFDPANPTKKNEFAL
jgi:hypothetical protein